jgi:hypothetical protein
LMSEKFYSALARSISAAGEDDPRRRSSVYRLSRLELKRQLRRRYEIEMQEQASALEHAIAKIETDFTEGTTAPHFSSQRFAAQANEPTPTPRAVAIRKGPSYEAGQRSDKRDVLSPPDQPLSYPDHVQSKFDARKQHYHSAADKRARGDFWWSIAAVVALGVMIYLLVEMRGDFGNLIGRYLYPETAGSLPRASIERAAAIGTDANETKANADKTNAAKIPVTIDGAPLPTSHGVYAVDHGKLINLDTLPIGVPNSNVTVSATIPTPSQTTVPDGHVQFVVFLRDLGTDVPDRASVRVIARVMHALIFDHGGPAKTVHVKGKWAIRNNAYKMKVTPVDGNPGMIVIRSQNSDFSFPPGRYALVVNGTGYDFAVAGRITDVAQCLERTDAVGAPIYTPCRAL